MYVVNEAFSAEGGILKIIYADGTEGYIAMTDESVTLKAPKMNTVNTKNGGTGFSVGGVIGFTDGESLEQAV